MTVKCEEGVPKIESKTWPQYLSVLIATVTLLTSGIHFAWPAPSLPKLLTEFPFNVTKEEASYIVITGPIGDIFGSILSAFLIDSVGRKLSILAIALPQIASLLMIYFSFYHKVLLYIGRFLGGIAEAMCFCCVPIYIGEVAEPRVRGALGSYITAVLIVGTIVINLVGSYLTIHVAALVIVPIPVLFMVAFHYMPETPYYLAMRDDMVEAKKSLIFLRRVENVEAELATIETAVKRQMSENAGFASLFTIKSNLMGCIIMATLRFVQQYSGVLAFIMYIQMFLQEATDVVPKHIGAIALATIQAVFTFLSASVVDRTGRKPLLYASIAGCFITLSMEAVFFTLRDYGGYNLKSLSWLPLLGAALFMVSFGLGLGNIVNLMLGEMFSASVKSKALCLMNIVFALTMTTSTKIYQYLSDMYSMSIPFYIFALSELSGLIFCYFFVPETNKKTLEQIQQELKGTGASSRTSKVNLT